MNKISKVISWVALVVFVLFAFIVISDYIKVQKVKSMAVYIKNYYDTNGVFPASAEIGVKFPSLEKDYQIVGTQNIFFIYSLFLNEPFAFGGQYKDIMWGASYGTFSFNGDDLVPLKCISAKFESGGECLCIPYKGEFPQYLLNWQHTFVDSCN